MSVLNGIIKESFDDIDFGKSFDLEVKENKTAHMNIRIPFCENKCRFCLYGGHDVEEDKVNDFVDGLKKEIDYYLNNDIEISSVYFNAGTPTKIPNKLEEIINYLEDSYGFNGEVLTEAHPCDLDSDSLDHLINIGINKIKIGVQSFCDDILNELGRTYSRNEAIDAVNNSLDKDFDHVSVDLMYSIPNQTKEDLKKDLSVCSRLDIPCVTFFPLMRLSYSDMGEGEDNSVSKKEKQYREIINFFEDKNHEMRTIWSFSKNPKEYRGEYMHKDDFIGLGPGNWSYFDDNLYLNTSYMDDYLESCEKGLPISVGTNFSKNEAQRLWLLKKLYLTEVNLIDFEKRFGEELSKDLKKILEGLEELNLVKYNENYLRLTEKGLITANTLTNDIVTLLLEKFKNNRLISAEPQKIDF